MATLKLRVSKAKNVNPKTKKTGIVARVITNGTADYDDIVEDAAENTTFNVDEIRAAAGIFCREAAKRLKQGYIVDLGPIGKLYPSCNSGWFEKEEDLTLDNVKPSLYYKAADEVEAAIRGAKLTWAKSKDVTDENTAPEGGTTIDSGTVTPAPGTGDQGGTGTIDTGDNGGDNGGTTPDPNDPPVQDE